MIKMSFESPEEATQFLFDKVGELTERVDGLEFAIGFINAWNNSGNPDMDPQLRAAWKNMADEIKKTIPDKPGVWRVFDDMANQGLADDRTKAFLEVIEGGKSED